MNISFKKLFLVALLLSGLVFCFTYIGKQYGDQVQPTIVYKKIVKDTIREGLLLETRDRLLHSIIYDVKENNTHQQNQKIIDEILEKVSNIYDSLVIYKFICVRTKNDTLISSVNLPVSADGFYTRDYTIKEVHENGIHLNFRRDAIVYQKIKPILRNGVYYHNQMQLYLLTNNEISNRQVWINITILMP